MPSCERSASAPNHGAADGGPVPANTRALGPDLARGLMLLCVALANSHHFLPGSGHLGGFPLSPHTSDRLVAWFVATFMDGRAFPLFGVLFGYGIAHVVRRQGTAGRAATRRLLWRRAAALVVIGVVDGLLFYAGDILAMYGVLLFVGSWVVFWRDRSLLILGGLFFLLNALPSPDAFSTDGPDASALPPDLPAMLTSHGTAVGFVALAGPIGFACPFLIGLVAGRRRILERTGLHRRLLVTCAVLGPVIGIAGAQPVALPLAGARGIPSAPELELLGALHAATGVLGGFGYAALIALAAERLERRARQGPVINALAATGQRSMTCYLIQSPAWAIIFTPFLLDLSGTLTITSTALLATGVWLGTVILADQLSRRGHRGPFERLLRRVTYRASPRTAEAAVPARPTGATRRAGGGLPRRRRR